MQASDLIQAIERLRTAQRAEPDWKPTVEPPDLIERRLKSCDQPEVKRARGEITEARDIISQAIRDYLADPMPSYMLLIRASPGVGKTTIAIEVAEELAKLGKRVGYFGPRHDLFYNMVIDRQLWYEWMPRQAAGVNKSETCKHSEQIETWMRRGYDGMDFCKGVCGWDFIKQGCPYHTQRRTQAPVIYAQHLHATLGHPIVFDVVVGDEYPVAAFLHDWSIPADYVYPSGMPHDEPLAEILYILQAIAAADVAPSEGPELIEILGGADAVIAACEKLDIPTENVDAWGTIHNAAEADKKPFFHIFKLAELLLREARLAKAGADYPHRIIAGKGHLHLLLRRQASDKLPPHLIWLDGTAEREIYSQAFGCPVKVIDAEPEIKGTIYQIYDRTNSKTSLIGDYVKGKSVDLLPARASETKTILDRIVKQRGYKNPGIVSFLSWLDSRDMDGYKIAHFYGARGTNELEDCDALFVVGTPQPSPYDLVKTAKMLWFERDQAFNTTWCEREATYNHVAPDGLGRKYPVAGFWCDAALMTLHSQLSQAEIIQAAHRIRPVLHKCDIWLFLNSPIDALPPDVLLDIREAMDCPQGVDVFAWDKVRALRGQVEITIGDIEALGYSYATASKYIKIALDSWPEYQEAIAIRLKDSFGRSKKSISKRD